MLLNGSAGLLVEYYNISAKIKVHLKLDRLVFITILVLNVLQVKSSRCFV